MERRRAEIDKAGYKTILFYHRQYIKPRGIEIRKNGEILFGYVGHTSSEVVGKAYEFFKSNLQESATNGD